MRGLKEELKIFNIDLDDIKEMKEINDNLQEAISKFEQENVLRENLQVILNKNLIELKNNHGRLQAIFGCKISLQELEESISFVLKPCFNNEKSADEMFEELGYKKTENRLHNVARYKKDDDNIIYFCEATKYSEADVHKSGEYSETCYGISMQELKAINKKCEELGWV